MASTVFVNAVAGISTTLTTANLVGRTLTISNGIITATSSS